LDLSPECIEAGQRGDARRIDRRDDGGTGRACLAMFFTVSSAISLKRLRE